MNATNHDKLAIRLAAILQKLNNGERLTKKALATEFGVNERTIARDLGERFAFLPFDSSKSDGRYALDPAYLGRITMQDTLNFSYLAGLKGRAPGGLDSRFIRELLDSRMQDTLNIQGHSYEDLQHRLSDFRTLQQAITERRVVRFVYQKVDIEKEIDVSPYRMVNHAGVWYLAATDQGKPKSYAFGKISVPRLLDETFVRDPDVQAMLEAEDSIWLNQKKTKVVLKVASAAAVYFQRRKLVAQQVIEQELDDGGLIVSGMFAHQNQILPIVRYWMPNVRIVSPAHWQKMLEDDIKKYLQKNH